MDPSKSNVSSYRSNKEALFFTEELNLIKKPSKSFYIGAPDFSNTMKCSNLIVDKTMFIKEVLEDNNWSILITRPRRWGKTMNLTMLRDFLQPEIDDRKLERYGNPKKKKYFADKKILKDMIKLPGEDSKPSSDIQGKIPVIFLTFSKESNFNSLDRLAYRISCAYKEHAYLEKFLIMECLNCFKQYFSDEEELIISNETAGQLDIRLDKYIIAKSPDFHSKPCYTELKKFRRILCKSLDKADLEDSLVFLSQKLFEYYSKKCLLIIDEYDTPFTQSLLPETKNEEAKNKELLDGIQAGPLKDTIFELLCRVSKEIDGSFYKIILTGVFPIADLKINSGLNNISENTLLHGDYFDSFGFTEEEVVWLLSEGFELQEAELTSTLARIKEWYNGYKIGNIIIYNAWDIVKCLNNAYKSHVKAIQPYWVNSGRTDVLTYALKNSSCRIALAELFRYHKIEYSMNYELNLSSEKLNEDSLLNVMFHGGYLTMDDSPNTYRIPNKELMWYFYYNYLKEWLYEEEIKVSIDKVLIRLDENIESLHDYQRSIEELILQNLQSGVTNEALFNILLNAPSLYLSTASKSSKYKSLPEYTTKNKKRIDSLFIPNKSSVRFIIVQEYKVHKHQYGIEDIVKEAIWQIYANLYVIEALVLQIDSESWDFVIGRALVFSPDIDGKCMVTIKEFKHNKEQLMQLEKIFTNQNGEPLKELMPFTATNHNAARQCFLERIGVQDIYSLINIYSESPNDIVPMKRTAEECESENINKHSKVD